ncbi:MAG TPA: hypothetical protein VMW86_00470 [Dehalococcoidales bacterium]|nr:hypothetical protein [Dehalococcoidales bacterium]
MTIDKTRLTDKCGELNEAKMAEVNEAIKARKASSVTFDN